VFSEVRGEFTAKGERISGRFIGGTGRYRGATGNYEFEWEYILETEDGVVQGRGIDLKGRLHVESAAETSTSRKGEQ
jgi:hypothetical protein